MTDPKTFIMTSCIFNSQILGAHCFTFSDTLIFNSPNPFPCVTLRVLNICKLVVRKSALRITVPHYQKAPLLFFLVWQSRRKDTHQDNKTSLRWHKVQMQPWKMKIFQLEWKLAFLLRPYRRDLPCRVVRTKPDLTKILIFFKLL